MLQTKQEQFDVAVRGIHSQGGPAIYEDGCQDRCQYRAPDGRKCAFGWLIPDELYEPVMDKQSMRAHSVLRSSTPIRDLLGVDEPASVNYKKNATFYDDLQDCHDEAAKARECENMQADGSFEKEFSIRLFRFAKRYDLNPAVIRECYPE